jgi:hypothetical protein
MKLDFNMASMYSSSPDDTLEVKALTQNLMKSMSFNFSTNASVKPTSYNASSTQDDGKTLLWNLIPGQDNQLTIETDIINTTNIAMLDICYFINSSCNCY